MVRLPAVGAEVIVSPAAALIRRERPTVAAGAGKVHGASPGGWVLGGGESLAARVLGTRLLLLLLLLLVVMRLLLQMARLPIC